MPFLTHQSVLVLGGSSGIGFAVASLCLANGMTVHLASSSPAKLADAAARLAGLHPDSNCNAKARIFTHVCAIGEGEEDVETTLTRTLDAATTATVDQGEGEGEREGEKQLLDHIVVTAGTAGAVAFEGVTQRDLQALSALRIFTPVLLAKIAPRYLKGGWGSSLVLTGGAVGSKPTPGYTYNSLWAGGLHAFVRAVALEWGASATGGGKQVKGRCNSVEPGATETELWGSHRDAIKQRVEGTALLGKVGSPEEVAEAYIYLMKDTNATGVNIRTDGGFSCQ